MESEVAVDIEEAAAEQNSSQIRRGCQRSPPFSWKPGGFRQGRLRSKGVTVEAATCVRVANWRVRTTRLKQDVLLARALVAFGVGCSFGWPCRQVVWWHGAVAVEPIGDEHVGLCLGLVQASFGRQAAWRLGEQ